MRCSFLDLVRQRCGVRPLGSAAIQLRGVRGGVHCGLSSSAGSGQVHRKGGTGALAAIDLDRASMQLEHHGDEVKADAAAGDADRVRAAEIAFE